MNRLEITSGLSGRKMYSLPYDDLTNKDLSEKDFSNALLRGMDLSMSSLKESSLTMADLSGCTLVGIDLSGCYVIGCRFDGSDLSYAKGMDQIKCDDNGRSGFYRASWKGCNFTGVDLTWIDPLMVDDPTSFFESCIGLPNGFVKSLVLRKKSNNAFGII